MNEYKVVRDVSHYSDIYLKADRAVVDGGILKFYNDTELVGSFLHWDGFVKLELDD